MELDVRDSLRRAELAHSYANVDVESLVRDITVLTQILMFKLYQEKVARRGKHT